MVEEEFYDSEAKPQIAELIERYRGAYKSSATNGTNDNIRFTFWEGQTADGRKWKTNQKEGEAVFPWDGASDTRVPLADQTIRDIVDLLSVTFSRANLRVAGVDATDAPQATAATHLVRWLTETKLRRQIGKEKKLAANFAWGYGRTLIYVGWEEELTYKYIPVTLEAIRESFKDKPIENSETLAELIHFILPHIDKKEAREAADGLFAGESVELPMLSPSKSEPCIKSLEPNRDYVVPDWTGDIQDASEIYTREVMSIAAFKSTAKASEWNEKWAEQVVASRGDYTPEIDEDDGVNEEEVDNNRDESIEIVTAFRKMIDSDGVLQVYVTVFSPHVSGEESNELFGEHYALKTPHGNYPFVEYKAENHDRRHNQSRGVPQVVFTWQNEIKTQRDALSDRASLDVLPPIKVNKRLGQLRAMGPAVQIPVYNDSDVKFEGVNGGDTKGALDLIALIEKQADDYYGRPNPNTPPAIYMTRQQAMADDWLDVWSEVFRFMFELCVQNYSPEQIARITGTEAPLNLDTIEYDFRMMFDVRELDNDYLKQKWETIVQLLVPMDSGGAVDRNRLVALAAQSIIPEAAGEIISDQSTASQKIFDQVKMDLTGIALGLEATYVENDPTASKKLEYMQKLLQASERIQSAIGSSDETQEMFQNYTKNLEMSVSQEENKTIGRIGVTPQQQQA